jgi:D-serine deaminase-like pyridoxal phosphate-dependent protein
MSEPTTIPELETPAAVVDLDRVDANLRRAAEYTRSHGLAWRPHAKTHKTAELGARQVAAGAVGLTVATPREAEVMASVAEDILVAYAPVGGARVARMMALPERVRLSVALDGSEALRTLASAARAHDRTVRVLVEIDAGMHRVGVPTPQQAVALAAEAVELPWIAFGGILFYPGHVRDPVGDQGRPLHELSRRVEDFVSALEQAGLDPQVVSGGSTPTLWRSHEVAELTEVRPGTDVFNDRTTVLIGGCGWEECAYSVAATVVSTSVPGQAVIDAGAKALAKEEVRASEGGYGAVLGRPEVTVTSLSEEHGILDLADTDWRPRVGDQVRVVPNHVCVSVNLQERLWVVKGEEIVDTWEVVARARSPLPGSPSRR